VLWQTDVIGGVMLEAGAELKVVTGLDPVTELQAAVSHRLKAGR
jgi:hypothetical protein